MTAIVYKSIKMLLTGVTKLLQQRRWAVNLNHLYFYQFYSNVLTACVTAPSNTESQTNVINSNNVLS